METPRQETKEKECTCVRKFPWPPGHDSYCPCFVASEEKESQAANTVQGRTTLLPCPFCGRIPLHKQWEECRPWAYIECQTAGCVCPKIEITKFEHRLEPNYLTARWNKRAAPSLEPQRPKSADASSSPKDSSPLSLNDILDQIEQRTNAATPGPWLYDGASYHVGGYRHMLRADGVGISQKDAEFLASSRTDVPALVKLARLANQIISECDPETVWWWKHDSTAILAQAK